MYTAKCALVQFARYRIIRLDVLVQFGCVEHEHEWEYCQRWFAIQCYRQCRDVTTWDLRRSSKNRDTNLLECADSFTLSNCEHARFNIYNKTHIRCPCERQSEECLTTVRCFTHQFIFLVASYHWSRSLVYPIVRGAAATAAAATTICRDRFVWPSDLRSPKPEHILAVPPHPLHSVPSQLNRVHPFDNSIKLYLKEWKILSVHHRWMDVESAADAKGNGCSWITIVTAVEWLMKSGLKRLHFAFTLHSIDW